MVYSYSFFKKALPLAEFKTQGLSVENFFDLKIISGFCIDSRKLEKDQIFVALPGNVVDGHEFLLDVLKKGALGFIIEKHKEDFLKNLPYDLLENKLVIIVENSLESLKQLAKTWRQNFDYPVIGITGSVGKTTTKQILSNIFDKAKISALISFKNQNSTTGLSLNVLKMKEEYKFAVFEMGISHKGEMEELADILKPTIGIITYISDAHSNGLGNIKEIAKEKQKIFKFFKQDNVGVVCGDKNIIKDFSRNFPLITFGKKRINNIQARMIKVIEDNNEIYTKFDLKIYSKKYLIKTNLNHNGFVNNSLAAASVATFLGIDSKFIVEGLNSYTAFEGRFEKRKMKANSGFLINDCYNASPESMKAAINSFSLMKCEGKKIAVIGDMLELGEKETFWHKKIGRFLSKALDLDFVILVGNLAENIAKTAPVILKTKKFKDWKQAKVFLDDLINLSDKKDFLILFKASHAIGLENIVKELS